MSFADVGKFRAACCLFGALSKQPDLGDHVGGNGGSQQKKDGNQQLVDRDGALS
jgi:hypothetical protein